MLLQTHGNYVFKICGEVWHWHGALIPEPEAQSSYVQIYFLEGAAAVSCSICIPNYFHFQPDTPDTPKRHPHYTTHMTTSINLESIINNTVGSIDFIAIALDT